jgi:hypothetical protein
VQQQELDSPIKPAAMTAATAAPPRRASAQRRSSTGKRPRASFTGQEPDNEMQHTATSEPAAVAMHKEPSELRAKLEASKQECERLRQACAAAAQAAEQAVAEKQAAEQSLLAFRNEICAYNKLSGTVKKSALLLRQTCVTLNAKLGRTPGIGAASANASNDLLVEVTEIKTNLSLQLEQWAAAQSAAAAREKAVKTEAAAAAESARTAAAAAEHTVTVLNERLSRADLARRDAVAEEKVRAAEHAAQLKAAADELAAIQQEVLAAQSGAAKLQAQVAAQERRLQEQVSGNSTMLLHILMFVISVAVYNLTAVSNTTSCARDARCCC